jgi:hypothetical protein
MKSEDAIHRGVKVRVVADAKAAKEMYPQISIITPRMLLCFGIEKPSLDG